jgi:hypothetical protein
LSLWRILPVEQALGDDGICQAKILNLGPAEAPPSGT